MIEEILKKIRETESEADEKKRAAEEKAAEIRGKADEEARALTEKTLRDAKANAENELNAAALVADEAYDREISLAATECEELVAKNGKCAEEIAAKLLGRVKDGDL